MDYIISPNCSDFGKPNVEFKEFPDGEAYIRFLDKAPDTIIHRLYPDTNKSLVQLLLMLNGIGKDVELVIPYLPYSRQDKVFLEGEVESAKIICHTLSLAGVKKLTTFDCHFLKKEGEFNYNGLKIKNISMASKLIEYATNKFGKVEVISPDQGASYMTSNGKSMKKQRGAYIQGNEAYREIDSMKIDFDVKAKNILIIDDMISSGSTMIKAIENVRNAGARTIFCAATHGFFLKNSFDKINNIADGIFVTDSILSPVSKVSIWNYIKK